MPRARTGTIEAGANGFRFRLRLADGSRSERFDCDPRMNEEEARSYVARMQADEDAQGGLLAAKQARETTEVPVVAHQETVDEWYARYLPSKECGESHRDKCRTQWSRWVSDLIGDKSIAALTRDDVECVRDRLDEAVSNKTLRGSTAANIWSMVTSAMKAATNAKDRSLRVHNTPLCFGVLPPKSGPARKRAWLYPVEWGQLASCTAVSVDWRQMIAIALYTGLRPNELKALLWGDVDLDASVIHVSKAFDEHTKDVKPPKTDAGCRVVPVQPALLPLLQTIKGSADAPVAPVLSLSDDRVVVHFRNALKTAGILRPRLWSLTEMSAGA